MPNTALDQLKNFVYARYDAAKKEADSHRNYIVEPLSEDGKRNTLLGITKEKASASPVLKRLPPKK